MIELNLEKLNDYISQKVDELLEKKLQSLKLIHGNESLNDWMTVDEAAEYLNLSKKTIYAYTNPKHLDPIPFEKVGKQNRYYKCDLDRWNQRRSIKIESTGQLDSKALTETFCPDLKKKVKPARKAARK